MLRPARLLHRAEPGHAETAGLLALMLLVDARAETRLSAAGELVLLPDQDRRRWDAEKIRAGQDLLDSALQIGPAGGYTVQAAIAAVHAEAPTWADTDWAEIVGLYDVLLGRWPSPVVALNRAVALGFRDGPQAGLDALEPLQAEPALAGYGYLSAARADVLSRLHRWTEAVGAYREALALTDNDVERAFLSSRLQTARERQVPT